MLSLKPKGEIDEDGEKDKSKARHTHKSASKGRQKIREKSKYPVREADFFQGKDEDS